MAWWTAFGTRLHVPVNGVAQIVNSPFVNASSSTTLHWIQTDATSLGTMASANLINDQVCQLSGVYAGVINVNVAQGYYYVVQSDGPGLATFGVTVSPAAQRQLYQRHPLRMGSLSELQQRKNLRRILPR